MKMLKLKTIVLFAISCAWALAAGTVAAAPAIIVDHRSIDSQDNLVPQQWLDRARSLRIYFGHQSVGNNILNGMNSLAQQMPARYGIAIQAQPDNAWFASHSGIGHFPVGSNGDAEGKINDFSRRMAAQGGQVDVAMMKLCFVDITNRGTDSARIFATYRDTMERLERAYPKAHVVWWTEPLTSRDNATRNEYNHLVRNYAAANGKALFDIADIESHDPQDREISTEGGPAMYPGYTQDGGHLLQEGQLRAARAWWWLLARLSGWSGPGVAQEAIPMAFAVPPSVSQPVASQGGGADWWSVCTAEREKFCRGVQAGEGRIVKCLDAHAADLSPACTSARKPGGHG